ncbi:MAG: hypothetical protein ACREN6_05910 [Gemmatimonadaceae bacterium]
MLLIIHSYLRWLVLLAGVLAIFRMTRGYSSGAVYGPTDRRYAAIFVGIFDLQFLIGLILYGTSPLTRGAMQNMTTAMQDPHTRFFVAEHPMMMFVALCVAHGASIWSRKATVDRAKFMRASLGFSLAMGLILAGIPWFRMGG